MFKDQDAIYLPGNLFIWFVLGFQGGLLNTGGFLSVHRFVSHVTGFATLAGVDGALGNWVEALGMLAVPCFFIVGAILSAWSVDRKRLRGKAPKYPLVFSIIIINLVLVSILGVMGFFGEFGAALVLGRGYFLLFLLSFVCGMQNAVISTASGSVIRTTHLTGVSTDFGIAMVKIWTTRKSLHRTDVFANWCRLGIIFSFIFGSFFGAIIFLNFKFYGFLFPAFLSLLVAIRLRVIRPVGFKRSIKNYKV